ncbi:MAG: NIL domain-containing protein [bacterium]|nr:NIL domain-containing protein [bacterium]
MKKKKHSPAKKIRRKVYLTFSASSTRDPIVCEMYDKFGVRFNIRSASVSEKVGLLALELEGEEKKIVQAFAYLKKRGVKVEPIEMDILEP